MGGPTHWPGAFAARLLRVWHGVRARVSPRRHRAPTVVRYRDRSLVLHDDELLIRRYYTPFGGPKRVERGRIRQVRPRTLGMGSGQYRLWGAGLPRFWYHYDAKRPAREVGLELDLGRRIRPVVTPADPTELQAALREDHDEQ